MNALPKVAQLSSRVWRFLGCNPGPMTLQGTNIYLVGSGPRRILVDAGQDGFPEYIDNLTNFLNEQNVSVEKIILTHWHRDHVGALGDMQGMFPRKPTIHKFGRKERPDEDLPEGFILTSLQDNQEFQIDGATLRVLFTPGHTSDHAALYLQEEKAIFSGDCILGEGTAIFEDLHDYMNSLQRFLDEDVNIIYPGHGPLVDKPKAKIEYYLQHRRQREEQILEVLRNTKEPVTPNQIVKIIYKDTPENLHAAAEINVEHHLAKLIKEKKIRRNGDKYFSTNCDSIHKGKM